MLFIDENKYPKIVLEVSNRTDLSLKTWEKKNIEPCGRLVTKINLTRPVRRKQTYNFFWPHRQLLYFVLHFGKKNSTFEALN